MCNRDYVPHNPEVWTKYSSLKATVATEMLDTSSIGVTGAWCSLVCVDYKLSQTHYMKVLQGKHWARNTPKNVCILKVYCKNTNLWVFNVVFYILLFHNNNYNYFKANCVITPYRIRKQTTYAYAYIKILEFKNTNS